MSTTPFDSRKALQNLTTETVLVDALTVGDLFYVPGDVNPDHASPMTSGPSATPAPVPAPTPSAQAAARRVEARGGSYDSRPDRIASENRFSPRATLQSEFERNWGAL